MIEAQTDSQLYIATALHSWKQWLGRADKLFGSLSDEAMLAEIAPGKNRPVYLLGHLTAVNDSMISQLRLGEAAYPHFRELFIEKPDRSVDLPATSELRQAWTDVNRKLNGHLIALSPEAWLERHATVSEEDFGKEPHRNRLAILLSRTAHLGYHLGQLMLIAKP